MKLELQKGSRSKALAGIMLIAMVVFAVRLFYIQIIRHNYYVNLANQEQIRRLTIPAKRGLIYALNGLIPVQLVMNETIYTVFADPQVVTDDSKIIETIRKIAGGNARSNLQELLDKKDTRYQILATKLTRTQANKIKEVSIKGVGFQEDTQRVYPEGSLAAQTLGFVNSEGKGQYGVEEGLNDLLEGKDGLLQSVTDVSDVPLTIGDNNINQPAKNGADIVLSIDRNIQAYAEKALVEGLESIGAKNGSIIVMDPQTGKIMAMANLPTYNPAEFNKVQDTSVFLNDVTMTPYEPGSVMKTLTIATGLDTGTITPTSTYINTDSITIDDRTIENATKGQTGTITMQHALNYSLNTGMVTIVQRLGDGTINQQARNIVYDYFYNRLGLGNLTGIEVAEVAGQVVSPKDTEGNAVRYSNMSFGQGLNVTMIQMSAAFSALINGGNYYPPTVIAGMMKDNVFVLDKAKKPRRVVSEATSTQLKGMLKEARQTFYGSQDKAGYNVGGKTGTSQTLVNGVYVDDQTIGSYLGYGGNSSPQYVIMIQVSGDNMNLEGSKHALPIFTKVSNWMIDYLKLQPEG
jgi:cell division protein FtsI/penicillin-binding protein 2